MNKKEILRNRLKAVLHGLREKHPPLSQDIDKVMPFIVFERELTARQLEELLTEYPKRTPADYHMITIWYIQQAVRVYHRYSTLDEGFRKANAGIRQLEQILCGGFDAYRLVYDEVLGYRMEKK